MVIVLINYINEASFKYKITKKRGPYTPLENESGGGVPFVSRSSLLLTVFKGGVA